MQGDPYQMFVGMIGVVGALIVFAILLHLGLWIVRLLKLPQDPPEDAHFSPPAPPIADVLSHAEAHARAAVQGQLRRYAHQAHLAHRAAQWCHESVVVAPADRQAALTEVAERAKAAAETADTAWRVSPVQADVIRDALRTCLHARREAIRTLSDQVGGDEARRRRMFILLAVLLVAWAASLAIMFGR